SDGVASGNIGFTTKAALKAAIQAAFGASNVDATTDNVVITGADYTTSFSAAAGTLSATASNNNAVDGSKLVLTQGSNTSTFRYVTSGAVTTSGAATFTSLANLEAAINADANLGNSGGPTLNSKILASDDGAGHLKLESNAAFTSGGAAGTAFNFNGSAATSFNSNYNSTLAGIAGVLSIAVGTNAAQTIDFGTVTTKAALATALAGITGVTASINGGNQVSLTSTAGDNVTISGTSNAASGLFTGANIGVNAPSVSAGTSSTTRSNLQAQYNALLTQIDQLANDSSYNGVNLLKGDSLKVSFNENGSSSLTITGVTFNSGGLGLTNLSGTEFQNNASLDTVIAGLDNATTTLRSQASTFGSSLTTVQARQD